MARLSGVDLLVDRRSQSSNLSEVARLDKIRLVVSEEAELMATVCVKAVLRDDKRSWRNYCEIYME